jgi:hypothetical protein
MKKHWRLEFILGLNFKLELQNGVSILRKLEPVFWESIVTRMALACRA